MVSESKVSISIMFDVMFWGFPSFDIHIILKNMFLSCFLHESISFFLFPFLQKHVLYHVSLTFMSLLLFSASYNKFLQFFFYVSNIIILCYSSSFVRHGLYGFDKVFTMLPCFETFKTCFFFLNIIFILGVCFTWLFKSIQQSHWCNQVVKLHVMFLDVRG
jgi:hypothetical protein